VRSFELVTVATPKRLTYSLPMISPPTPTDERQYLANRISVKKRESSAESGVDTTVDSLTGFMTLDGFLDTGKYLLAISLQLGLEVKAICVEVKGFEQYNQRHGAAAGDRALVEIAQALVNSFRECDLIGRIGNGEFCVLLSAGAESRPESRLQRLEEHLQRVHAERMPELRFAIGVSTASYHPQEHGTLEKLVADAEARLRERV